jgi:hypothetical protein
MLDFIFSDDVSPRRQSADELRKVRYGGRVGSISQNWAGDASFFRGYAAIRGLDHALTSNLAGDTFKDSPDALTCSGARGFASVSRRSLCTGSARGRFYTLKPLVPGTSDQRQA